MSQELLTTFLHFKTILIKKLEQLEFDIKETIVKLN